MKLNKKEFEIRIVGCDDTTFIRMFLDTKEIDLLERLTNLSKQKSDRFSQPIMSFEEVKS